MSVDHDNKRQQDDEPNDDDLKRRRTIASVERIYGTLNNLNCQYSPDVKESIEKEGFKEEFPIVIMLRRENNEDKLFEGHHRLNIAIELGLATVPVRFMEWQKEYNAKGRWVDK